MDKRDGDRSQDLVARVGVYVSFVARSNVSGSMRKNLFSINYDAGNCSFDVTEFVENTNMLAFVPLLHNSSHPFVSNLLSGLSLAA